MSGKMDSVICRVRGFVDRVGLAHPELKGLTVRARRKMLREDGATIVEMALTSLVLVAMIFGIIEMCTCLYAYNYVAEASREATRYAMIRGSESCTISSTMPNCNLGPTNGGSTAVQTFVQGLGYPYSNGLSATAAWFSPSGSPGNTWTTACTTATDSGGNPCNQPGNAVQVTVTYTFPIAVPLIGVHSINLSSTSQMMISE